MSVCYDNNIDDVTEPHVYKITKILQKKVSYWNHASERWLLAGIGRLNRADRSARKQNVLRRHDLTRSDVTIEKTAWRCVAFRDFEDICIGRSKQLTTIACGPFLCCTTKRKNLHIDQSAPEWAKNTAKRMNTVYARGDINGSCSRHLVGACIL